MENYLRKHLIRKYLSGTITEEELKQLKAWHDGFDDENWQQYFSSVREEEQTEEKVLGQIWVKIKEQESEVPEGKEQPIPGQKSYSFSHWPRWYRAAAVFVLTLGVLLSAYKLSPALQQSLFPVSYVERVAPAGQGLIIHLEDGSIVELRAGAKVTYATDLTEQTERQVSLTGEAYFQVAKNPSKPFLVRTPGAVIRVVGTQFNVKEMKKDSSVVVAVTEGVVAVRHPEQPEEATVKLTIGQIATLQANQAIYVATTDITNYVGWRSGWLTFQGTALTEVARQLEYIYDIKINIESKDAGDKKLTATLQMMPLPQMLEVLEASLGVHIQSRNSTIFIN